jgi:hypothetical protein
LFGDCDDRFTAGLELLGRQPDVGVTPEAPWEDTGSLDGWRLAKGRDGCEGADRDAPAPAFPRRIVFRVAVDLDDREDVLPPGRVADREIALLQARSSSGGVRAQRARIDTVGEEAVARSANEEPMLGHPGFLTARNYALRIRTCVYLGLLVGVLAVAGCGSSDDEAATAGDGQTTVATTTDATTDGIDPLEGAGTAPVVGTSTAKNIALLERVAVGRHEGFDRVVFQFREGVPGYRVEYIDPPIKEDGSGNVVQVKGNAYVQVRMEPASGFDLNTAEGVLVYKGPKRIDGSTAAAGVIQELVRTGDFEAVLTWVVGLSDRVDFRVTTTQSPARLIVDFRNH